MTVPSRPSVFWNRVGRLLQALPEFPTKGRWEWMWFPRRDTSLVERRRLPGGALIDCYLADYNEAWVWMRLLDAAELRVLHRLLQPGETFVDVGAHIGVWSLVAGSAVGAQGSVIAIEPNPSTFQKLEHNLELNPDLAQWQSCNLAASSRPGTAALHIAEMSECCALGEAAAGSVTVPTSPLDSLLAGVPCHGLKIDVEGHELDVIEGALATLERSRPWLCVEFNNTIHHLPALAEWTVHRRLTELGYRCWLFRDAVQKASRPNVAPEFTIDGFVNLFYSPS